MKKNIVLLILLIIVLGGLSGWVFTRYIIPRLSTVQFLAKHNLVPSSAPLVINTREEVRVNEGSDSIAAIQKVKPWVVAFVTGADPAHTQVLGSGLIVTADGLIATTKNVVGSGQNLYAVLNDGTVKPAEIKAQDSETDLVFAKVDGTNMPTATFGISKNLQLGQRVIALSGSTAQYQATDIISYLSSEVRNVNAGKLYSSEEVSRTFQVDGVENAPEGSAILSLDAVIQGIYDKAKIIPAEAVKSALNSYFSNGKITRNFIGITYQYIPKSLSALYNVPEGIVLRKSDARPAVLANSPAQDAGLKEGDIITQVNGAQVNFDNAFEDAVAQKQPGDIVVLTVARAGQALNLNLKIGSK